MLDSEIVDEQSINEDSYDGLVSLIEASKGILSLLIASCQPGDFQTQMINRYEAELAPKIPCYRVVLNQQEPSLRAALEQLVKDCPELKKPHVSAAITVTGTEALMEFVPKADSNNRSELSRFFGYLQWTREGLREFPYPIVLWVTPKILSRLSIEAPDFWSWRSGVFRFVAPVVEATGVVNQTGEISLLIESERRETLPLEELLDQVENLEQQAMETPALATLYNRVANSYANRVKTGQAQDDTQEIDRAIHFFEKSLVLQRELNFRLAESDTLLQLGDIYRDLGLWERVFDLYEQSLAIARNFKDSLREAAALGRQGNLYQQYPQGDRANNLERAIASYTAALIVYTRDAFPEDWAMTQNNLAVAYSHRIKGEKAENIEQSMECYQSALCVYTRDTFPKKWAMTQNNLAIAYSNRIRGYKADNIEMAIVSYNAALTVYTRDAFPEQWAMTQNNLGLAYSNRIMGEKVENIEREIDPNFIVTENIGDNIKIMIEGLPQALITPAVQAQAALALVKHGIPLGVDIGVGLLGGIRQAILRIGSEHYKLKYSIRVVRVLTAVQVYNEAIQWIKFKKDSGMLDSQIADDYLMQINHISGLR